MNQSILKAYAPKARTDFIEAVSNRAAFYGISKNKIEPSNVEGDVVLISGKAFSSAVGQKRNRLIERIKKNGFDQVIENIAYTWFNRFVAIRYMEIHDYLDHGIRILSHSDRSKNLPEILEKFDQVRFKSLDKEKAIDLKLNGSKEAELYQMLLVSQCNELSEAMPFLFERVDHESELLLPENLLNSDSIVSTLVQAIPEENWQEVEVIGWLYQYYISEKKDEVIGKVVKSEDIPAATQLFTPNWIVQYMVQNTLGAKWMAAYPNSKLKEKMPYYIEPAKQTNEVYKSFKEIASVGINPEELTFLDPACGSGHILIEAYNLFKEFYLELGYRQRDIPKLIIEKNIYGIDIDIRAAQLAGLSILMKARADNSGIFSKPNSLNIMSIQETNGWDAHEIADSLFSSEVSFSKNDIKNLVVLFEDAQTFGSLVTIPESVKSKLQVFGKLVSEEPKDMIAGNAIKAFKILVKQAILLSNEYDVVVANPPYMGSKSMNVLLKDFVKKRFPDSKSNLFSLFIDRNLTFAGECGMVSMITMQSWMFLSSFEELRTKILSKNSILSMMHLGTNAFDSIGGEVVSTTAFVFGNSTYSKEFKGTYLRLVQGKNESEKVEDFKKSLVSDCKLVFFASSKDFSKIPGQPIAYWVTESVRQIFTNEDQISKQFEARQGLGTGADAEYFRYFWEVDFAKIAFKFSSAEELWASPNLKWVPLNKGGSFRKWSGNREYVISYDRKSRDKLKNIGNHLPSEEKYFKPTVSWSDITSNTNSFRFYDKGFLFSNTGHCIFSDSPEQRKLVLAYCNNIFVDRMTKILNPTIHFHVGYFNLLPNPTRFFSSPVKTIEIVDELIEIACADWDYYETSWDFKKSPFLDIKFKDLSLEEIYTDLRIEWNDKTARMKKLEEENNKAFIKTYELEDELNHELEEKDITLFCNPEYRYGKKDKKVNEKELFSETLKELVSYAIGCFFGRFSTLESGFKITGKVLPTDQVFLENKSFKDYVCKDGIIPVTEKKWFENDAAARFISLLSDSWPNINLDKSIVFVAEAITNKACDVAEDSIRKYFANDFYKFHLQMYKKRPIYWLFTSGKYKAFQCLIYIHRYDEGTLAIMRTDYVIPLQRKISARIEQLSGDITSEKSASILKKLEIEKELLTKQKLELYDFDEKLRHFADKKIIIDLDDGIKVNYTKFGDLLAEVKAVAGGAED